MIVVSVCLCSDALSELLPSYLGFCYVGHGVSLTAPRAKQHSAPYFRCEVSPHGQSSEVQPLLLTLDVGYLLTSTAPDLGHGVSPLSLLLLQRCTAAAGHFHSCVQQDPGTPQRLRQNYVSASAVEVPVGSGLPQGQRLWIQQTLVWHKPSWRRSPLTPP